MSDFEIEADILVGGTMPPEGAGPPAPPFSPTFSGVDWGPITNADEACAAVVPYRCSALVYEFAGDGNQCPNVDGDPSGNLTVSKVCDNPNDPGDGEFFQDGLKSEGDLTTFTQGDKENDVGVISAIPMDPSGALQSTTPWHIVPGSVQPNKDDLFNTYAYSLIQGSNADVVLAFTRTNNNGSSHVDFELNRFEWEPCDFQPVGAMELCPVRAEGDILIAYEITQGGAVSGIQFFKWNLPGGASIDGQVNCTGFLAPGGNQTAPCPWQEVNFDPNNVFSTLNPQPITAGPWGSKLPDGSATNTIGQFGFFETFLDFDALGFGPGCPGFATASLKSRASGSSVTSALSDLSGPFPLDLNNCGQITIVKDASPADGTDFTFTASNNADASPNPFKLDDSASSDTGGNFPSSKTIFELGPDTYTVQEGLVTGWTLTDLVCVDDNGGTFVGDVSTNTRTASIELQPEQEVTCTFTNQGLGTIKVKKLTVPSGASQNFTFTGDASGTIGDTQSITVGNLLAGPYSSTETVPEGWDLTDISCDDAAGPNDSSGNLGTKTANFLLDPGETVTCTFTNTERGSIKIDKLTVGGEGSFNYTATEPDGGTDIPSFTRDTSGNNPTTSSAYTNLLPGKTYNIVETEPEGWDATNLTCSGDSSSNVTRDTTDWNDVSIVLAPGENIECTFTNTKRGTLIIRKKTIGGTGTFDYDENVTDGNKDGASDQQLTTIAQDTYVSTTINNVVPGTYTVTELDPGASWDLTALDCTDDDGGSSENLGTRTGTAEVDPGETVTCSFTNTKRGTIIVEKQTLPDGAPGSFTFTGDASGSIGDGQTITVNNLVPGTYTSTEADPTSLGYALDSISCDDGASTTPSTYVLGTRTATFELDPGETVKCTFTNKTGAIKVTKTAKNWSMGGVVAQSDVSFNATATGKPGGSDVTDASGEACIDGLVPGTTYTVTETVPTGYVAAGDNPKTVDVTNAATCSLGTPNTVEFLNYPLSKIEIKFTSLAGDGVTIVDELNCYATSGPAKDASYNSGDLSDLGDNVNPETATLNNLLEGDYICNLSIDP